MHDGDSWVEASFGQIMSALEPFSVGTFLIARDGRVRDQSVGALNLISDGEFLVVRDGILTPRFERFRRSFQNTVASVRDDPGFETGSSVSFLLPNQACTRTLRVEIAPLIDEGRRRVSGYAIVFLPSVRARGSVGSLLELGLTVSEAEIALELAVGQTPSEIADQRGSRLSTVRSHIQAIFQKLDLHRMAELVAFVNGLPDRSTLGPDGSDR